MAKRGQLTPTVQEAAKRLLGREITQVELRLMPYVQYCVLNSETIHPAKISSEEMHFTRKWVSHGYLENISGPVKCGRYFWDVMSELLWLSYADHENQPE